MPWVFLGFFPQPFLANAHSKKGFAQSLRGICNLCICIKMLCCLCFLLYCFNRFGYRLTFVWLQRVTKVKKGVSDGNIIYKIHKLHQKKNNVTWLWHANEIAYLRVFQGLYTFYGIYPNIKYTHKSNWMQFQRLTRERK